jgi:hypothetical protein
MACGLRSRKSFVNHRSILTSTIAAKPLSRTVFSRPSQMDLSGKNDEVLERTSLSIRPGAFAPSHCPTIPPIDSPHQLILAISSASMTARTSRPSRSIV